MSEAAIEVPPSFRQRTRERERRGDHDLARDLARTATVPGRSRPVSPAAPATTAATCLRSVTGGLARLRAGVEQLEAATREGRAAAPMLVLDVTSARTRIDGAMATAQAALATHRSETLSEQLSAARAELARLAPRATAALDAQARVSTPAAVEAALHADLAALSTRLGLGAIDVRRDDRARSVTDAHDARGIALGSTVYLHPERCEPGTTDGREVIAHELVHLAQAQLSADGGGELDRGAAEQEAAELAPQLARGAGVARPRHRIDLSRPAADHGKTGTKAKAETTTPTAATPAGTSDVFDRAETVILAAESAWLVLQNQIRANELGDQPSTGLVPRLQAVGQQLREATVLLSESRADPEWRRGAGLVARITAVADQVERAEATLTSTGATVGTSSTATLLGHGQPAAEPAFTRGARTTGAVTGMQAEAYIARTPLVHEAIRRGTSGARLGTGRVILHDDLESYVAAHRQILDIGASTPEELDKQARDNARSSVGVTDPLRQIAHVYAPVTDATTTIHELMHLYTDQSVLLQSTRNLCEGAADYYTEKVCAANGIPFEASYPGPKFVIGYLAEVFGEDKLAAYIFGGSKVLIQAVELLGEGTWKEFLHLVGAEAYIVACRTLRGARDAMTRHDAEIAKQNAAAAAEAQAASDAAAATKRAAEPPESEWPQAQSTKGKVTLGWERDGRGQIRIGVGGNKGVRDGWRATVPLKSGETLDLEVHAVSWKTCEVTLPVGVERTRLVRDAAIELARGAR